MRKTLLSNQLHILAALLTLLSASPSHAYKEAEEEEKNPRAHMRTIAAPAHEDFKSSLSRATLSAGTTMAAGLLAAWLTDEPLLFLTILPIGVLYSSVYLSNQHLEQAIYWSFFLPAIGAHGWWMNS